VNWRDSSNPSAGGAETFTEEIGRRLVSYGNEVTIFTSSFDGCDPEARRFGMRIVRDGGKYSVYSKARTYVKRNLSEFDIVVDEINTVPFRISRIAKGKPVVAVIHQLAKEVWFYETRFPISVLGYFVLEPLWLRGYRSVPTVTVSNSTRNDLLELGFEHVHIIHNGIGIPPLDTPATKESNPVLIFVGRLVRCKLPEHAIAAFRQVRESLPDAELWILGDGYLRRKLEESGVDGVRFFGRVSDAEKFNLMKRAHVLLVPSVREGWGISVIEANAMGTPAVAYGVHGLKDSVVHGVTGLLVSPLNSQALAKAAEQILRDPSLRKKLSVNALDWSRKFCWEEAAKQFNAFLESLVTGNQMELGDKGESHVHMQNSPVAE
jgi:glycosyltransferase involved in cell wall biosynthesis